MRFTEKEKNQINLYFKISDWEEDNTFLTLEEHKKLKEKLLVW